MDILSEIFIPSDNKNNNGCDCNVSTCIRCSAKEPVRNNEELLKTIPHDRLTYSIPSYADTHTEWRWRILKINDKKVLEVSKKLPNEERKFLDKYYEWKEYNLPLKYNDCVLEQYYYYSK